MKQVARLAGVSQPTVSDVLRGQWRKKGISADTQNRILKVANELGYRPNRLAKGLSAKRSKIVGIILSSHALNGFDPYVQNITSSLIGQLRQYDYRCIVEYGTKEFNENEEYKNLFAEKLVDALVLMQITPPMMDWLVEKKLPFVLINARNVRQNIPCVMEEIADVVENVIDRLIRLGRRRLCYLSATLDKTDFLVTNTFNRWSACKKAFVRRSSDIEKYCFVFSKRKPSEYQTIRRKACRHMSISHSSFPDSIIAGYAAGLEIVRQNPMPDGIIAMNDWLAYGAMLALMDEGIRVPQAVSIVGWDNIDWSAYTSPALTTISFKPQEFGRKAGELLLKLLNGNVSNQETMLTVQSSLIIRESCGTNASFKDNIQNGQ